MRKLSIVMLVVLLLGLIPSTVIAQDDNASLRIGQKFVTAPNTISTYNGIDKEGHHTFTAAITNLPTYCEDLVTPIDPSWHFDGHNWVSEPNIYQVTVANSHVTLVYNDNRVQWQPTLTIDNKAQRVADQFANLLIQDPINENYYGNTLQWWYGDISRNLRIIEGMLIEYYTIAELPAGDVAINYHFVKDPAFNYPMFVAVRDAETNPVDFTFDGQILTVTLEALESATLPVTIDPDWSLRGNGQDAFLYRNEENINPNTVWNDCRTAVNADTVDATPDHFVPFVYGGWDGDDYYCAIRRIAMYYNTDGIPDDAVITDAYVDLYVWAKSNQLPATSNYTFQNGMPSHPERPAVVGDYDYFQYAGIMATKSYDDISTGQYNSWDLTAAGIASINLTGWTKWILRESYYDIGNVNPMSGSIKNNYISFYAEEKGDGFWHILYVHYINDNPDVSTLAASQVASTGARLNSIMLDDADDDCIIGFGWGNVSHVPSTKIGNYTNVENITGTYNTGEYGYLDIDGLTINTTYYFRVCAWNSYGYELGDELNFTTAEALGAPTNFVGYPSSQSISLSWAKGDGAALTEIRYGTMGFPTNTTQGTLIYNSTGSSYPHSNLTSGKTYYYTAWGYSGTNYSANYTTLMMTTSATITGGDELEPPTMPTGWFAAPNYTGLTNLLFIYDGVNGSADAIGMPRATAWIILGVVASLIVGLVVYFVSGRKLLMGLIAVTVCLFFGSYIHIIPWWIPTISLIGMIVLALSHREVSY